MQDSPQSGRRRRRPGALPPLAGRGAVHWRALRRLAWAVWAVLLAGQLSTPLALWAIKGYQHFISPVKGWRCAYASLHGGPGCSAYAADAILQHGLAGGVELLCGRFGRCREAAAVLAATSSRDQCDCSSGRLKQGKGQKDKQDQDSGGPAIKTVLKFPIASAVMSSRREQRLNRGIWGFGANWTHKYVGGKPYIHAGVDWPATPSESVRAVAAGTIKSVSQLSNEGYPWGGKVVIEHSGAGLASGYYHVVLDASVKVGAEVKAGQLLGRIFHFDPNEGIPDHLHFEMRQGTYRADLHRGALPPDVFADSNFVNPEGDLTWE